MASESDAGVWGIRRCPKQSLPVPTRASTSLVVLRRLSNPGKRTTRILVLTPPSDGGAGVRKVDTCTRDVRGKIGGRLRPETCPARDGGV